MVTITREDIRAKVTVGNMVIETPDVINFSVSRSRGQPAATFNTTLEIDVDDANVPSGENIVIEAGLRNNLIRIFTGTVNSVTVNPHWEKSNKFIVTMQGTDLMAEIQGKRFSRRQRTLGLGKLAIITGIVNKVQNKGHVVEEPILDKGDGGGRYLTGSLNLGDVPSLVKTRGIDTSNPYSLYAKKTGSANRPKEYDLLMDPSFIQLPQDGSGALECLNCTTNSDADGGIEWNVLNPDIASVSQDANDPTKATVIQLGTGNTKISVRDADGRTGYVEISGILIHDHANLGSGGPSFGVYKSG